MLRTAGHVKKYYKPCCILFEDFKNRQGNNVFKGDMLEIFGKECAVQVKHRSNPENFVTYSLRSALQNSLKLK